MAYWILQLLRVGLCLGCIASSRMPLNAAARRKPPVSPASAITPQRPAGGEAASAAEAQQPAQTRAQALAQVTAGMAATKIQANFRGGQARKATKAAKEKADTDVAKPAVEPIPLPLAPATVTTKPKKEKKEKVKKDKTHPEGAPEQAATAPAKEKKVKKDKKPKDEPQLQIVPYTGAGTAPQAAIASTPVQKVSRWKTAGTKVISANRLAAKQLDHSNPENYKNLNLTDPSTYKKAALTAHPDKNNGDRQKWDLLTKEREKQLAAKSGYPIAPPGAPILLQNKPGMQLSTKIGIGGFAGAGALGGLMAFGGNFSSTPSAAEHPAPEGTPAPDRPDSPAAMEDPSYPSSGGASGAGSSRAPAQSSPQTPGPAQQNQIIGYMTDGTPIYQAPPNGSTPQASTQEQAPIAGYTPDSVPVYQSQFIGTAENGTPMYQAFAQQPVSYTSAYGGQGYQDAAAQGTDQQYPYGYYQAPADGSYGYADPGQEGQPMGYAPGVGG